MRVVAVNYVFEQIYGHYTLLQSVFALGHTKQMNPVLVLSVHIDKIPVRVAETIV